MTAPITTAEVATMFGVTPCARADERAMRPRINPTGAMTTAHTRAITSKARAGAACLVSDSTMEAI